MSHTIQRHDSYVMWCYVRVFSIANVSSESQN